MRKRTRYDRLNKPSRVALAEQIALLALDIEEQTGKAVIYMTKWDIAQKLQADPGLVSQALSWHRPPSSWRSVATRS